MGLTSTEFILLLPIVVLLYYISSNRLRGYYLLGINILFYMSFGAFGIVLVAVEAVLVQTTSYLIKKTNSAQKQKLYSMICTTILVSLLVVSRIFKHIGETLVASIGLSFYTLGAISYVEDVRNQKLEPETNFISLLTWLSFFPTITAGPIYRYSVFKKEYERNQICLKADYDRITNGIIYVIYGYFLKLVIAERIAIPVNFVFEKIGTQYFNSIVLIIIAVSYSIQIYTDFAGYSAIVIGIAQILGYYVPENFIAPYLSRSVKEFWGRWHISLSTWLRDYIYIPLGGNKKGIVRKYINIFITFIVSAFWHGTGVHFLVWGGMHASYQTIEGISSELRKRIYSSLGVNENTRAIITIARIKTFVCVTIAWLFFKTGIKDALLFIREIFIATRIDKEGMWLLSGMGIEWKDWVIIAISILIMIIIDKLVYDTNERIDSILSKQRFWIKGSVIICLAFAVLAFGMYGDQHDASYFIYRDF